MPSSLDAEQSTLGACLIDPVALAVAVGMLKPSDFYRELHKTIFTVMFDLFDKGSDVTIFDVADRLRDAGKLEEIGGSEYLSALIEACASTKMISRYCEVVQKKSDLRKLILAADEITAMAYSGQDADEVKTRAESLIRDSTRDSQADDCVAVGEAAIAVATQLESQLRNRGRLVGLSTGFVDLDNRMGGLRKSHLFVVGARPGMGKSAFALQLCYHVAKSGKNALFFCFEMSSEELVHRLICMIAKVDSRDVELGYLNEEELGRFMAATREVETLPLFIQDTPEMTTQDMRSRARRIEAEHGEIGLIVVDYLQLVDDQGMDRGSNRARALAKIAKECHAMGKERGCTVLALSQLSNEVEKRENPRPMLLDINESGGIAAQANRVGFLYRPGYYQRQKNPHDKEISDSMCEFILAKNRGGKLGTVRFYWTGKFTRFDNMTQDKDDDE